MPREWKIYIQLRKNIPKGEWFVNEMEERSGKGEKRKKIEPQRRQDAKKRKKIEPQRRQDAMGGMTRLS
jgi:hypothetical protein